MAWGEDEAASTVRTTTSGAAPSDTGIGITRRWRVTELSKILNQVLTEP
jgi:hypothetical protein